MVVTADNDEEYDDSVSVTSRYRPVFASYINGTRRLYRTSTLWSSVEVGEVVVAATDDDRSVDWCNAERTVEFDVG